MNVNNIFTEVETAIKGNETELLSDISTITGLLSKNAAVPTLLVEGGQLLASLAMKYPDPKVQLVAGLATALLTAIGPTVTAATAAK